MVLPGCPDPSFLLQHFPFPFSYQVSILSVTIGRCHTNQWPLTNLIAGCHSQTARHHTLTFKENDPNRWLVPNTNNCIKPRNKVKKGEHLAFSWATKTATGRSSTNSKQNFCSGSPPWGSDGLNRKTKHQSSHFTSKEPPIALTIVFLPLFCIWEGGGCSFLCQVWCHL